MCPQLGQKTAVGWTAVPQLGQYEFVIDIELFRRTFDS